MIAATTFQIIELNVNKPGMKHNEGLLNAAPFVFRIRIKTIPPALPAVLLCSFSDFFQHSE